MWDWNENDWLEIASNPFGLVDGVIIPVGKGVLSAGAGALAAGDMAAKAAAALGPLINEVMSLDADTWQKLYEGRFNEVRDKVSPQILDVVMNVHDLMSVIRASMSGMSAEDIERKMGEIFGGLVYDALEDMAIGAATAGAGVLATKSEKLQKLINRIGDIPGLNSPSVKQALDRFTGWLSEIGGTKICFVAGTPVHTSEGVKPIEEIRDGDLVLTRPEDSDHDDRRILYRPVVGTVITHPTQLIHIEYQSDDGRKERLSTTLIHPFYVAERGTFVDASDMEVGETLSLPEGRTATVLSMTLESAAEGTTFTTYNFEVAETHTYFVGNLGVWVHNTGADGANCQKIAAELRNMKRLDGKTPSGQIDEITKAVKKAVADGTIDPQYAGKHFDDILDEFGLEKPAVRPDFTAKGADARKVTSPNAAARAKSQGEYVDPLTNRIVKTSDKLAADHIFPKARIKELPGFNKLTPAQQSEVLNNLINFRGLPQTFNASKGSRIDWSKYKGQPLDPQYAQELAELQQLMKKELQAQIDALLGDRK